MLVLASGSPQRRWLLKSLGLRFLVRPSGVPERSSHSDPRHIAADLALQKARAVAKAFPDRLVLGSDTLVVCRGEILGKPRSRRDAVRILGRLNGRWHRVHTGVALVRDGAEATSVTTTRVKARKLGAEALKKLLGKHMDKAGAYAVQDREDPFIQTVAGPLDNVIGFPRKDFLRLLKKFDKKLYKTGLLKLRSNPLDFK